MFANGLKMVGSAKGPRGLKLEGDEGWIFIHVHGAKLEASDPNLLKADPEKFKERLKAPYRLRGGRCASGLAGGPRA